MTNSLRKINRTNSIEGTIYKYRENEVAGYGIRQTDSGCAMLEYCDVVDEVAVLNEGDNNYSIDVVVKNKDGTRSWLQFLCVKARNILPYTDKEPAGWQRVLPLNYKPVFRNKTHNGSSIIGTVVPINHPTKNSK